MLKLKDANVLIIKEFPNKNISISSLMLSLGIKQHKILHINAPADALKRTFHGRFDILICDHMFNNSQLKSLDVIREMQKANVIDDGSVIIMDCLDSRLKDASCYLADVHLRPENSQQELQTLIRRTFDQKNKVIPLLRREGIDSAEEMEQRYQFFEQHYLEYQYDLKRHRAYHYLSNRELKKATEIYGVLIKDSGKRDHSLEISLFLNALVLNGQSKDALELFAKFASSKFELGQPFDEIGVLIQLREGNMSQAADMLKSSGARWGFNLAQRSILALTSLVLGKYDEALVHFSSNVTVAKILNQNVAQHTLNYLFSLLMLWMRSEEGSGLYERKFNQVIKEISRLKLKESEHQHLAIILLHAEFLLGNRQNAESVIDSFVKKVEKTGCVAKLHALYLSSGLSNKAHASLIFNRLASNSAVFMFEPLPPACAALVKAIDFKAFSLDMQRCNRVKVSE
ncbi:hypothetical protein ACFFUP_05220 [Vibrio ostreicida]|uniref:Response regulator n=1 Tax=Vibrio ostreicida TaxID=526588 RepID=A0ABT8BQR6_9VIBR|nr:hypothetical protein [Vibrio ostreicida]MDN3609476.1 hypothetical protein [Vibrio ostreicida]NPD08357.1 hypothetical protein [Vibrio ostreicida]